MPNPQKPAKEWPIERVINPEETGRRKHSTHLALIGDSQTLCLTKLPRKEIPRAPFDGVDQPTCTNCWALVRDETPLEDRSQTT